MVNYKATISYDGTQFSGFQTQKTPGVYTVQDKIQSVLSRIFNKPMKINGAGRTDTGVHALGQVINFKAEREMSPKNLQKALNGLLDDAVSVLDVEIADPDFHARYSAKSRKYLYIVDNSSYPNALTRNRTYRYPYRLDLNAMKQAIKLFEGEHDFRRFAKGVKEIENTRRSIISAEIITSSDIENSYATSFPPSFEGRLRGRVNKTKENRSGKTLKENQKIISAINKVILPSNRLIFFYFKGLSFLHSMVRLMVGNLIEVGKGNLTHENIGKMLKSDNSVISRALNVPGKGLYLVGVDY